MNKKTYTARSIIMVSVVLSYSRTATISFMAQEGVGSVFITTDGELQNALESHSKYNQLFWLSDTEVTDKSVTEPKVRYYEHPVLAIEKEVNDIDGKIPEAASSENQLADKAYVNDGIATSSADFKGTFTSQTDMDAVTGNKNDYAYLITSDAQGNIQYNRYKWVDGTGWVYEYTIKQDNFTTAEWAAIQSGITTALVAKLSALPTNSELENTLGNKANIGTQSDAKNANTIYGAKAFATDAVGTEAQRANNISAIMSLSTLSACATVTLTTNPEWKLVWTDNDDRILMGKRQDDSWYFGTDLDTILDVVIDGYSTL